MPTQKLTAGILAAAIEGFEAANAFWALSTPGR
jgi:hypothetical protein